MGAVASAERVRVRKSAAGPQGGGVFVPVSQRARLLDATVGLVVEVGVRGLTVRRLTARAGMSSKTFYDLFADRDREISERAGVSNQGQMSGLLWRLEDRGLVENTGGYAQGTPKAWSLTVLGEQALLQASSPHDARSESV
jgi:AcrR family transcriptional regulator